MVSLVYIGCGAGAAASFFVNDRIGRMWSQQLYSLVWIVGQMIATGSCGSHAALYTARIVSGLGIGALTVTGPVSLVEIAPTEIRGLIAAWFTVALLLSLFLASITVYGIFLHIADSRLQYQIVWFAPCIFLALVGVLCYFYCVESPRWLFLVGRDDEAVENLVALRGLPADHPRVAKELEDIRAQISHEQDIYGKGARSTSLAGVKAVFKETFTIKANLRRVQQTWICYALAQLSGANSITSYFIPIMELVGVDTDGSTRPLFLSAMYSFSKLWFTIIASFFFIDAIGRRKSLFTGITVQMLSHIYIGVFIKYSQQGSVSVGASQAAIALVFIHGFGYAVGEYIHRTCFAFAAQLTETGLLVLPYVFGAEVWPNGIRSFGSALSQTFHWLFFFGVNKGMPGLLKQTNNWGAFLFFAGWCFLALIYVYLVVPELAGADIEDFDALFEGSWFIAFRQKKILSQRRQHVIDGRKEEYVN